MKICTVPCRSQHTLPITSIHCGRTMDPVVVTTSLDQRCNVYSMAKGAILQLFGIHPK